MESITDIKYKDFLSTVSQYRSKVKLLRDKKKLYYNDDYIYLRSLSAKLNEELYSIDIKMRDIISCIDNKVTVSNNKDLPQ